MLAQQPKKRLFVFVPAKAVLGVADLEAIKMQLAEHTLVSIAIRSAEYHRRTVAFIAAAPNYTTAAEEGKPGARGVRSLSKGGEAVNGKTVSEIEVDWLAPLALGPVLFSEVGCAQIAAMDLQEQLTKGSRTLPVVRQNPAFLSRRTDTTRPNSTRSSIVDPQTPLILASPSNDLRMALRYLILRGAPCSTGMTLDRATAATLRARGIVASEVWAVPAIATGARNVISVACSRETSTCRVGVSASRSGARAGLRDQWR
jgi:hypothetical protein